MRSGSSLAGNESSTVLADTQIALPNGEDRSREVERSFREFRESSVRLVERVTDLTGPEEDGTRTAPDDIQLVRSIFGKWSPEILMALHSVPSIGFENLRRGLNGIAPRVLSLKLRNLEDHKMIFREIVDARPPRVRYALTDRGWTVTWLAHPVFLYLRHLDPALLAQARTPVPGPMAVESADPPVPIARPLGAASAAVV